jgi:MoaA/NifB/PqqE/SkfB family radical SAM enzyme
MVQFGTTDVTLSGGEPTLHPDLPELISYFHKNGIGVHILSNGERFSDRTFADRLLALAEYGEVTVTTTFHSWKAEEHEYQNATPGSFRRSLEGIRYLDERGLRISVKHCITANNYQQLPEYLQFVMDTFSPRVEIQLWGIDLFGLTPELARENFADFHHVRPYIQTALDLFEQSGRGQNQILTINNLPLCMCDSYYWRYFTAPEEDSYIDHNKEGSALEANAGPISMHCVDCPFRRECMGAYFSDFEILGDDIVHVPVHESLVDSYQSHYPYYTSRNAGNMFFSPYLIHRLGRGGYRIINYLAESEILLRMRTNQALLLQKMLTEGVSWENLTACLDSFGMNGAEVTGELMRKGIVE